MAKEYTFEFTVFCEHEPISESQATELLYDIIELVERRGWLLGGTFTMEEDSDE